ncbi:tape measure protein [Mesorhizobium sp. ASY16-5R]|uniref:tape measure protein n=1 Tax=Mesorhizobium sp. ASY16-5R TaxID=3445772 RepID=UPI003F9F3F63
MATDIEKLVVQLSADIKGYEREMRKARGVSDRESRAVVKRWDDTNKRLSGIGRNMARGLVAPLAGVAGALTVREVLRYADAWTRAKNSLSIAGVQGANQKRVLDQLYQSAQDNAAPIEALTGLYGKAAQAGDVLGATQEQLIEFSDGVAVALKVAGTGANEARGALTQLGQLLGSTRVQAEEFNSVNDGARPILQAVANGLDKAGGSVSKLKQLVNDGEVSGREFFNAFLKGLPQLRAQAAGATQTIEQGYIKINNALTKYIGQTDSSLGASQRLVQGLNALADNFDETADTVLMLAGVIAGALVGRSLAGMIAKLGLGAVAIMRFVRALAAARTIAATGLALGGLGAAAGPIGFVIGTVAAGALVHFSTSAAEAAANADAVTKELEDMGLIAKQASDGVDETARSLDDLTAGDRARKIAALNTELERLRGGGKPWSQGDELASIADDARAAMRGLVGLYNTSATDKAARTQIADLADAYREGTGKAKDILATLRAMADTEISQPVLDLNQQLQKTIQRAEAIKVGLFKLGDTSSMDAVRREIGRAREELTNLKNVWPTSKKVFEGMDAVIGDFVDLGGSAEEAKEKLAQIAGTNLEANAIRRQIDVMIDALAWLREEAREVAAELGGIPAVNTGVKIDQRRVDGLRSMGEARETARAMDQRLIDAQRSQLEQQIDQRAKEIVKEFGDKISEQAARIQARTEISLETQTRGGEGAVSGYVDRTIGAESGGNRFAKNPRSSAEGLGQFIDSTWLSLFRKYFPGEAAQLSQAAILAMKTDAAKSKALIEAYGNENADALRAAGIAVADAADEYKLHLAHFLGPQGAINVLKAAPGTPLSQVLDARQIAANPEVLGGNRTVEDAIAYGQKRAGMSTAGTQRLDSRETFQASLAEYKQTIDFLKEETGLRASLNPLIEDYGRGLSTLQAAQELLNMAQEEGTAAGRELSSAQQLLTGDLSGLTPEAREQALAMRELAEASGSAQAASNQLDDAQGRLRENLGELSATGKDILSGFIQDLRSGKTATEALGNALGKLGDKFLDAGLNLLFDAGKPGSGGGIFGSLLGSFAKIFGFADGGWPGGRVRGPGGPRGDKIPIMVSDGEHITNARSAKKYGPLLDAINNDTLARMADGGWPMRAPVMASMPVPGARGSSRDTVDIRLQDDSGRMADIADQRIVSRSGTIINVAVQRANKGVMPAVAKYQQERAGADWRTGR